MRDVGRMESASGLRRLRRLRLAVAPHGVRRLALSITHKIRSNERHKYVYLLFFCACTSTTYVYLFWMHLHQVSENTSAEHSIEPWVLSETSTLDLGDRRLNHRCQRLMSDFARQPTASLPKACGS